MLAARAGHLLHPEYLQPLPSTPISPIELDAKKSPLALLAQTCSQIGKSDPPPATKGSSPSASSLVGGGGGGGSGGGGETKAPLKMSDLGADDKSSFKPYNKDKKEINCGGGGERFRVPAAATCMPFTPRTCSPRSVASVSPTPPSDAQEERKRKEEIEEEERPNSEPTPSPNATASVPAPSGLVAPVSPFKASHVPPSLATMSSYPYSYTQSFLSPGVALDAKASGGGGLLGQFSVSGAKVGGPMARASPPGAGLGLCRDPFCLGFHCGASCESVKSVYPLVYAHAAALSSSHATAAALSSSHAPLPFPPLFYEPLPPSSHACNWVSANGACDKRFVTSEELLAHLRTHTALGADSKHLLLPGYHGNGLPMCHVGPALRGSHHHAAAAALGLSRFHPYKPGGAAVHVPAHAPYYSPSPYILGQRLAPALYQ